ncbi:MAG: Xaa-Pro peptidase family protein [Pseudomonadota bacterium]
MLDTVAITAGSLPEEGAERLRRERQEKLRAMIRRFDIPALLLSDPVSIRYACDARNMQVYALNHDARYLFLAAEGPAVLFDWVVKPVYFGHLSTLDEVRLCQPYGYVAEGDEPEDRARRLWAAEIADLVRTHCGQDRRLGIDRLSPFASFALAREGVEVVDGSAPLFQARAMKSADEIAAIRVAMAACDAGFAKLRSGWRPGITEVELWAELHHTNIAWEGEWINARYLTSGQRTNPWSQEASLKVIAPGEVIGCDSDLIGPYGYAADISRSWIAEGRPDDRQRRLYAQSYAHLQANIALCRPGTSFRELTAENYRLPAEVSEQMFNSFAHGIGLENEWPVIKYAGKVDVKGGYGGGYDGVLQPGMTLCIESYVGEEDGPDGIKLEEQILVTEGAPEVLSRVPFEEDWL